MDPVLSRTTIRDYTHEDVSDDNVESVLRAAMAAPSAEDQRPWHFLVIRDGHIREQILGIHRFAHMVPTAPVAVLVCGDPSLQKARGFWVQDCAAATENILIEAQWLGLGAVWLGVYPIEGRVEGFRDLLGIPGHIVPFSLVALGHPASSARATARYDPSRVHADQWERAGESPAQGIGPSTTGPVRQIGDWHPRASILALNHRC